MTISIMTTFFKMPHRITFVLHKKQYNVNKTHQLIPGVGIAILEVMEPHLRQQQDVFIVMPHVVMSSVIMKNVAAPCQEMSVQILTWALYYKTFYDSNCYCIVIS
jgi:hypothetical protein